MKKNEIFLKLLLATIFILFVTSNSFASVISEPFYNLRAFTQTDLHFFLTFTGSGDTNGISLRTTADIPGQSSVGENSADVDFNSEFATFYAFGNIEYEDFFTEGQVFDGSCFTSTNIEGMSAYGYGNVSTGLFGQFQAQTEGILSISIYYQLFASVQTGSGQTASANSSVLLDINGEQVMDSYSNTSSNEGGVGGNSGRDTLSISYDLDAGQIVDFAILTRGNSLTTVPIPNSILCMGTGFILIIGICRRKQRV